MCAGATLFGDPGVGSVQIMVQMINRNDPRPFPHRGRLVNALGHTLVRLQDLEFRIPISAIQTARRFTKSVGLGGNGQFSRLSALDVVADKNGDPWRGALLEDYELSLHLLMTGHRNEYTQDTYVDQEGLPDIRRLIRQRTRWGQGTMQCGMYLRQLWTSPYVATLGALEATYYLMQPWLQLVGTLIYPIPAAVFIANYAAGPSAMSALDDQWRLDDPRFLPAGRRRPVRPLGPAIPAAVRTAYHPAARCGTMSPGNRRHSPHDESAGYARARARRATSPGPAHAAAMAA